MPRALVLQAAGINCDRETARAFELAGAEVETKHVNTLDAKKPFDDFQLLAIPGGFSYGDDVAAGRILGDRLVRDFGDALRAFVDRGHPIIGICNGFQVLVSAGILPGGDGRSALATNAAGQFTCRWVTMQRAEASCVWTSCFSPDEPFELPLAHAEGRLVSDPAAVAGHQALSYRDPSTPLAADLPPNPNGSLDAIAGLTDTTGLVLGLMPHPERYLEHLMHPAFTANRAKGMNMTVPTAGLRMFQSAVERVQ